MKFSDIPQFPKACYDVRVPWANIERHLKSEIDEINLNLDPDYQRCHVWTEEQQIAYVEYRLMGGETGTVLTLNCHDWMRGFKGPYELVDGKQRLEAARKFVSGDLKVFGCSLREFEDEMQFMGTFENAYFNWKVMSLPTREEVLKLYVDMNAGGTPHTEEEINRVRKMLKDEQNKEK